MASDPLAVPQHLRRTRKSSGADPGLLPPPWRRDAAPGARRALQARHGHRRHGTAATFVDDPVRTLLGLPRNRPGPALRGLLLPGHRLLPAPWAQDVRAR